jgi:hypothetical protein
VNSEGCIETKEYAMQYASDAVAETPRGSGTFRNRTPWIVAAVVVLAAIVSGVYVANNVTSTTEDVTTAAVSTDTELLEEATPFKIAEPGITSQYFGYSGELFPEEAVPDPLSRSLTERQLDQAFRSQTAEAVPDPLSRSLTERQLDQAFRSQTAEAVPGTASVREEELMEALVNQGLIPAAALEGAPAESVDSATGGDALDRAIANGRLGPPPAEQEEDALYRAIANGRLNPPAVNDAPSRPGGSELGRIGEPMP